MTGDSEYSSLSSSEELTEIHDSSHLLSEKSNVIFSGLRPETGRRRWLFGLCLFEILQLVAFGLAYGLRKPAAKYKSLVPDVNGYSDLATYNKTVTYSNDLHLVEPSEFGDHFWNTFMPRSAVVAIATDTVRAQGIPESAVSPTNSNEMLYQIDGFHELHCLWRLRRLLIGTATRTDHAHTLHCLNYIRQTLMCNLDLTLGSTTDYENYGLQDKRVCRDYDAIVAWTERNNWNDFEAFQNMKVEHHKAELEANNGSAKSDYKSPYV